MAVGFAVVESPEVGDMAVTASGMGLRVAEVNRDGSEIRLEVGANGMTGWVKAANYTLKRLTDG